MDYNSLSARVINEIPGKREEIPGIATGRDRGKGLKEGWESAGEKYLRRRTRYCSRETIGSARIKGRMAKAEFAVLFYLVIKIVSNTTNMIDLLANVRILAASLSKLLKMSINPNSRDCRS